MAGREDQREQSSLHLYHINHGGGERQVNHVTYINTYIPKQTDRQTNADTPSQTQTNTHTHICSILVSDKHPVLTTWMNDFKNLNFKNIHVTKRIYILVSKV